MNQKKILVAACLTALTTFTATAQQSERDYESAPYTFVTVQGGGQITFTNSSFKNLATPIGSFSVGHYFSPAIGARLNLQGWKNKAGYKIDGSDKTYDFKYLTTDVDLMFNLCNIFAPKKNHVFNAILLAGAGLSCAWDKDGQDAILAAHNINEPLTWNDNRLVHNLRVGMQFEVNVAKHVGINLEVAANHLNDRFNAKTNGNPDWQATGMIGVTYKFGFRKKKVEEPAPEPTPVVTPEPKPEVKPTPVAKPEPKPEVKPTPVEKAKTRVEVFFAINKSEVSAKEEAKVKDLAEWLKKHPSAKVDLTGYADAGTGTSSINKRLSKERVNNVANLLVKKYGIAADRVITDHKGDTVQPFAENDSNRVAIGIAEEK